jgi:hypothetical protein
VLSAGSGSHHGGGPGKLTGVPLWHTLPGTQCVIIIIFTLPAQAGLWAA